MPETVKIGLALVLLAGATPALSRVLGEPPPLEFRYPDAGLSAYDRVTVDCLQLDHAYGRNAAWGRWKIPLDQIRFDAPAPGADTVSVAISCRDGSNCIQAGKLEETPDRIAAHSLTFSSAATGQAFIDRIEAFRAACARAG